MLQVGQAERLDTDVPPVIEREAQERVARYAEEAGRAGRIAAQAHDVPGDGWFATPTLAADLPEDSPVLTEEIFGPLLAVERVRDVADACDRLDASPFALTAGLFARNPDTVDYVVDRVPVGNLYVNRAITGAMVARQPFGGNRLSGTGTKAGGPGYLLQFVEPRVVTRTRCATDWWCDALPGRTTATERRSTPWATELQTRRRAASRRPAATLTGDDSLKREGKVDKGSGKVKDAVGGVSDKAKDAVNSDRK